MQFYWQSWRSPFLPWVNELLTNFMLQYLYLLLQTTPKQNFWSYNKIKIQQQSKIVSSRRTWARSKRFKKLLLYAYLPGDRRRTYIQNRRSRDSHLGVRLWTWAYRRRQLLVWWKIIFVWRCNLRSFHTWIRVVV